MPPRTVVPLSASSLSLALLGFGCKRRNCYEITNFRILSGPNMDQIMKNYYNAMLILGLILSLTCLVYCSKNGSSSSDFIVNATQRNLSCKDFLRNIEMRMGAVCGGEEVAILGETLSLKAPVDACYGTTICSSTL